MIKKQCILLIAIFVCQILLCGYHNTQFESKSIQLYDTDKWDRGVLNELPQKYDDRDAFAIDLRSYDLSNFDLISYEEELSYVSFDTDTKWPHNLPSHFDPNEIMELGKNPGLGIRSLHEKGITGKGVSIAIIDTALVNHNEYIEKVMLYEELHCLDELPQMHGAAVTSIAVGDTIGVAPDAKLYYIASTFGDFTELGAEVNLKYMADAIMRILEINESLSDKEKIKVISISRGIGELDKGADEANQAIQLAQHRGIFVITTMNNYNFQLLGLRRDINSDPDNVNSYTQILKNDSYLREEKYADKMLFVPMDARTYAFCTGPSSYAFNSQSGYSFTSPWLAGMYALCLQLKPDITPDLFITAALELGDTLNSNNNANRQFNGRVINPSKLIDFLVMS